MCWAIVPILSVIIASAEREIVMKSKSDPLKQRGILSPDPILQSSRTLLKEQSVSLIVKPPTETGGKRSAVFRDDKKQSGDRKQSARKRKIIENENQSREP